nr:hypothetical protein [uncultured Shinella sp.]
MAELSCILLAGPNGSGKSSAFPKLNLEGEWINADEIGKALSESGDGNPKSGELPKRRFERLPK